MQFRMAVVISLVVAAIASRAAAANVSDFIDFSLRAENNALLLPGRLYVPPSAANQPRRPLILFLHGAGESGTDNVDQVNGNIDNLLAETKLRDAYLYAPQTNIGWAGQTILTRTMTMVEQAIAEYQVDPNRIYVTGLSMGGGGVWNMITSYPDQFAAAVPICPVFPSPFVLSNLLGQPIWDFHARNDTTVSVNSSRSVISNILIAAGQPLPEYPPLPSLLPDFQFDNIALDLHYTEYVLGGHGIWGRVYRQQAMYDWMFGHSLVPEPTSWLLLTIGSLVLLATRHRESVFSHRRAR